MHFMGINANIMKPGRHRHRHRRHGRRLRGPGGKRPQAFRAGPGKRNPFPDHHRASKEVGPALFYSLLIITVSFLPVFALGEQSGRMFKPLAYTKTFAMAASSVLAITIVPVLMTFFVREEPLIRRSPAKRSAGSASFPSQPRRFWLRWRGYPALICPTGASRPPWACHSSPWCV